MGKLIRSVSGNVVNFKSAAEVPFESLVVNFKPMQSGSGDPSPINIRPISGWTGVNVSHTGKNLFDKNTPITRGQYISQSGQYEQNNNRIMTDYIHIESGKTYTFSVPENNAANLAFINYNLFDENKTWIGDRVVNGESTSFNGAFSHTFTANLNGTKYVRLVLRDKTRSSTDISDRTLQNADLQLEYGDIITDYESYSATTYPVSWTSQGTIYGGYVDLVSGVLIATHSFAMFDGSGDEDWKKETVSFGTSFYINIPDSQITYADHGLYCNELAPRVNGTDYTIGKCFISTAKNFNAGFGTLIAPTDVTSFKTWLQDHVLQVVYRLGAIQTYQLTPQQLKTLRGVNNIWSDANGTIEVEFEHVETKEISERKRRVISEMPSDYIKNGLVLWLDGIDKGSTSGAWTDKAAGHVFENVNGFTDGSNYVGLDANSSQYFRNATFAAQNVGTSTIEMIITDYINGSIIFMPITNGVAFGVRQTADQIIWASGNNSRAMVEYTTGAKAFSIRNGIALINGQSATFGANNAWGNYDSAYNYIGRRNYSSNYNYATAKIYAIRIYNRQLTQTEMLHNQRIDNRHFKLGLNI